MVITEVRLLYESEMCPGSDRSRFQLVTGEVPFSEHSSESSILLLVLKGKRPAKPRSIVAPGMNTAVWKIAKKCWNGKPNKRPEVGTVLRYLEDIAHRSSGIGVSEERSQGSFGQCWRDVFSG